MSRAKRSRDCRFCYMLAGACPLDQWPESSHFTTEPVYPHWSQTSQSLAFLQTHFWRFTNVLFSWTSQLQISICVQEQNMLVLVKQILVQWKCKSSSVLSTIGRYIACYIRLLEAIFLNIQALMSVQCWLTTLYYNNLDTHPQCLVVEVYLTRRHVCIMQGINQDLVNRCPNLLEV